MGYYSTMLLDKAKLKTTNGTDANGVSIVIAEDDINCKIEFQNTITVNSQGNEETSSGRLFTESVVKTDDIIEFNEKSFRVITVNPYYPLGGKALVINEVYFK